MLTKAQNTLTVLVSFLAVAGCSKDPASTSGGSHPHNASAAPSLTSPESAKASATTSDSQSDDVSARVRRIVARILEAKLSPALDDAPFASLPGPGDELAVVEVVLALEEDFHIEIPDEELQAIAPDGGNLAAVVTISHLVTIVERRLRKRARGKTAE